MTKRKKKRVRKSRLTKRELGVLAKIRTHEKANKKSYADIHDSYVSQAYHVSFKERKKEKLGQWSAKRASQRVGVKALNELFFARVGKKIKRTLVDSGAWGGMIRNTKRREAYHQEVRYYSQKTKRRVSFSVVQSHRARIIKGEMLRYFSEIHLCSLDDAKALLKKEPQVFYGLLNAGKEIDTNPFRIQHGEGDKL